MENRYLVSRSHGLVLSQAGMEELCRIVPAESELLVPLMSFIERVIDDTRTTTLCFDENLVTREGEQ